MAIPETYKTVNLYENFVFCGVQKWITFESSQHEMQNFLQEWVLWYMFQKVGRV
jgi:hypothetical protein